MLTEFKEKLYEYRIIFTEKEIEEIIRDIYFLFFSTDKKTSEIPDQIRKEIEQKFVYYKDLMDKRLKELNSFSE